ncbi:MAG: hypothetical protein ACRENP_05410 [Longimicrobiales bacterium]
MRRAVLTLLLALSSVLVACRESGDQVLGVDATGDLLGEAYLDRDGDGRRTPTVDPPFPRLRVEIVPATGGAVVATALTDSLGRFRMRNLAVGSYRVRPDPFSVGDSVRIERIDSALVTIAAEDTAVSVITIGYTTPTMAQIASMTRGTRVGVFATALNAWATFGDSTIHLADSTGTVRAVLLPSNAIAAGDRVRATATVTDHLGRVALSNVTLIFRTPGDLPAPIDTTTRGAARAGGRLDAAQVRIRGATVQEASSLPGGDVRFTVDDRSGPLEVLADASAGFLTNLPIRPSAELDVTGVLTPVADGSGRWRLKPRFTGDVIVRYPRIPIATARTRQPQQIVTIHGIVLNDVQTFGNRTVHVADATAAIRVISLTGFFAPGDSVSITGQINVDVGQPIVEQLEIAVLARRVIQAPLALTTARAATADNGQRDAALVRLTDAVFDTVRVSGELRQGFNDGSGFVQVVPPTVFQLPALGARVDMTGLLVPIAPGRWVIRPRSAADVVIR